MHNIGLPTRSRSPYPNGTAVAIAALNELEEKKVRSIKNFKYKRYHKRTSLLNGPVLIVIGQDIR
jgi:hypothetical protein